MRELEAQLANAHAANEEAQQTFAIQSQEADSAYREKLTQLESDYQSAVHYVKGTEKMLKQLKEQLARYKSDNARMKSEMHDLEDRLEAAGDSTAPSGEWEAERNALHARVTDLEAELRSSGADLQKNLDAMKQELESSRQERDDATRKLDSHRKDLEQLQSENSLLEKRATDAEQKVSLLLDQVEHSVDNYRRQSRQVMPVDGPSPSANGATNGSYGHTRQESSEAGSVYGANGVEGRNSAALDNLASELETLRSHWEATNKNYRLSTNFEFDSNAVRDKDSAGIGLSESLADWRKRLDHDEPGPTRTS
jgi:chromosome segregation ATPase